MTLRISMQEQQKNEKAKNWIICSCGRRTYQKDGICVICKIDSRRAVMEKETIHAA